MKLRYWVPLALLGALGYAAWRFVEYRNQPPEVSFIKAIRETISSSVSTNGTVEPEQWAAAKAEIGGPVARILVQLRQRVAQGDPLVELDTAQARIDLQAAEARIEQVRAEYALLDQGGRAADKVSVQNQMEAAALELSQAQREYERLLRLQSKGAVLRSEVDAARDRVEAAQQRVEAAARLRPALVEPSTRASIDARLKEAEIARDAARLRIEKSTVRAPIGGVIYQFDLKPGAFLNPGDTVATIGVLNRVRIKLYVDEPDLGRVQHGMPVVITWDAAPGREWKGAVDRLPTQIVALGARQVGEVICLIANPEGDLIPGTNVNAVIRSEMVEGAITIAKEALFRQDGMDGVYILEGNKLAWRSVTQGVANVTRTQVHELKEGDAVAVPGGRALSPGMVVRPVMQ